MPYDTSVCLSAGPDEIQRHTGLKYLLWKFRSGISCLAGTPGRGFILHPQHVCQSMNNGVRRMRVLPTAEGEADLEAIERKPGAVAGSDEERQGVRWREVILKGT